MKRFAIGRGIVDFNSQNGRFAPVVFDFTTGVMPAGINFSRASSGLASLSAQQSPSTVTTTGYNTNVPRFGKRGALQNLSLVFEEARTNRICKTRVNTFTNGTSNWLPALNCAITYPFNAGPDGSVLSTRDVIVLAGNNFGKFYGQFINHPAGEVIAMSHWYQSGSGAPVNAATQIGSPSVLYVAGATWARLDTLASFTSVGPTWFFTPTNQHAPQDLSHDLHQVELGGFPGEVIITDTLPGTRPGEKLWITDSASVVDRGRVSKWYTFTAKGSSAEYSTNQTKIYFGFTNATNFSRMDTGTRALEICVNGLTYTSPVAMAWNRFDLLDVFVASGAGTPKASYRTNSGAEIVLTPGVLPIQSFYPIGLELDLMCSGTTGQVTSWLERIQFFAKGGKPPWVA